jgi:hypothetical protein
VYETPSLKWFLILGFCVGMIALIRPTDILFGFIPLLYTGLNWQEKKAFFLRYWKFIVAAAVLAFLLILPQLIYWKILSGQFLFYSYGSQGFNWKHPEIKLGLFGAGNGWLVYSPIMLFSMAGMLFYRKIKPFGLALWVIFPLYVYVIYSWYCFFYLNGIGSRPMIHLYPLLAFPMMVCLNFIWRKQGVLKFVLILFVGFTLAMNINFSLKKINKLLWSEGATYGFLRETFFRNYLTYNDLVTQDINVSQPDTNQLHWMGSLSNMVVTDTAGYLETKEFSDSVVTYVLQEKDILPKAYIKCSGQFNVDGRLEDVYRSQVMQVKVEKGSEMLSGYGVRINNKMGIQAMEKRGDHSFKVYTVLDYGWDELSFFIHLPKKAAAGDKITFRTWNTSWLPLHIKYLKLDLYQSK